MKAYLTLLLLITFVLTQNVVIAGGPLSVRYGISASYGNRPMIYRFDLGMLGKYSNEEAVAIIKELFSRWESISTATIRFQQDTPGYRDFDINEDNIDP